MSGEVLVRAEHLVKEFPVRGGKVQAVTDVSLEIARGETLALVGESGCGKSTLGRLILRLIQPTSGRVTFDGHNVTAMKPGELRAFRRRMQLIFQDPYSSLDPRMRVKTLIAEPLRAYGVSKEEQEETVRTLAQQVGLRPDTLERFPHEFSGGQRQRIGIARAIALHPDLVVCDEPVSALDVSIQAQILNLLQDLQQEKGLTYMFITHNLSVVRHISHKILVMYLGVVVEKCPADELFERPLHPYTKGLLSAIPIPSINVERHRILLQGELSSPVEPKPGCRFANRCPYASDQCRQAQPPLTEITPDHFIACHHVAEINSLEGART